MLNLTFHFLKFCAVIFYGIAIASIVEESLTDYQVTLLSAMALLLIAHVIEFIVVKNKLNKFSDDKHHFVNVLLFGFLYWIPLIYWGNAKEK